MSEQAPVPQEVLDRLARLEAQVQWLYAKYGALAPPEGAPSAVDNPYRALLGTADGFVVTGDSISMLVEVAALGKPLAIFPLPTGLFGSLDQLRRKWQRKLFSPSGDTRGDRLRQALARAIYRCDRLGLLQGTRDFRYFHELLVERHLAVWAGEPLRIGGTVPPDDLRVVVERIRGLVGR